MLIELHIIQNFAPSNLNRDDTNNPKDCEFGGVRRARISSQCLKRSIRSSAAFSQSTRAENGVRTKWVSRKIRHILIEAGKPEAEVDPVVNAFMEAYAGKMDKTAGKTSVLLYLSPDEIRLFAGRLLEAWETYVEMPEAKSPAMFALVKDLIKVSENHTSAPDIALFGRMLADKPQLSLDAACQVAHAISTHRVSMEMDFYTAVDDMQTGEESGAGMMGLTGFNSACFYRYACIDWDQLVKNLDGDEDLARCTVEGFLRGSIEAVPSGKQTSFAAQNPPSFMLAVVRQNGAAWSLANAFEKAVNPRRDTGLVGPSVQALDNYWGRLVSMYGPSHLAAAALALDEDNELTALKEFATSNLNAWLAVINQALPEARPE